MLIWLVVASLLPGVIGAVSLFVYEYRDARAQREKDTIQTARALAQAVDNYLFKAQAVAQALSISDALAQNDLARFHREARHVVALAGLGTNVVLRDEAGRQVLNTVIDYGEPLTPPPAPEQVRRVFQTAKPSISDIFIGPVVKRPIVSVDVPVIADGKVIYALAIGILPERFNTLLKSQDLPSNWVAAVFDSKGSIVARTHSAELFVGRKASASLLEAVAQSPEGSVEATTVEGIPVQSSYSRSPATDWGVAIGIPRTAHGGLMLARTLLWVALGVGLLFTISLIVARFMSAKIARSVQALIGPATALGRGDWAPVPPVHINEAAEVAQAIERAAALLKERAAKLHAKEAELIEAHRLAKFGSWHWNLVTGEVATSESIPEIYGRDVPSFPEQRGTVLTVESWERVKAASEEAMKTGIGYDLELQVNHGRGDTIWINSKCEVVRNEDGGVVALRGAVLDITERKQANEKLRESEEKFRLLADNIAQLTWMADGDGSIFWYNRRWFDYTGSTLEEMQHWGWVKLHHPDHVDRVIANIRHCFATGEPWEDTFPLKGADGEYRWFLSRAIPERDAAGRVFRWFGTSTDVTTQRGIEEELRKFKHFSDYANDVHFVLDASGHILYANKLASTRLGYSEQELLGLNISDIDPQYQQEWFEKLFVRSKLARPAPFEAVNRCKDGTTLPVEVTSTVLEFGGEWLMFATSRDITERKLAEQRVVEAAMHDRLTGLPNRALVFEYGSHLFASAHRSHTRGAVLFIDLDRFKPINDLYGHKVGDRVLQEVAKRLISCTRQEDLVGRLGGDEFVIILPHLDPGQHRAAIVAQHVIDSVTQPFHVEELELSLSPSIGISYFPQHAMDVGLLIHTADMAMYQAKQSGRANYQFYTPELERIADEMLMLETKLKSALRHGGLELYYQPVVDIKSGRMIGAEALVRLSRGDGGIISPEKFIPVAESAGLITELGEWVATEACRQHDAWLSEGLRVTIAINVSPLQFRQRAFAQRLGEIVAESNIDPQSLQIEVTESAVMESVDEAIAILNQLKALGMKVALDDFGTGYSSLSSLSSLPLDKLKVDQSFVRRIVRDPRSQAITKAVIALGRALHLEIVGEGIETEETLRYLYDEGCDQAQGFWFSEPLPAAEFASWCRNQRAGDRIV